MWLLNTTSLLWVYIAQRIVKENFKELWNILWELFSYSLIWRGSPHFITIMFGTKFLKYLVILNSLYASPFFYFSWIAWKITLVTFLNHTFYNIIQYHLIINFYFCFLRKLGLDNSIFCGIFSSNKQMANGRLVILTTMVYYKFISVDLVGRIWRKTKEYIILKHFSSSLISSTHKFEPSNWYGDNDIN